MANNPEIIILDANNTSGQDNTSAPNHVPESFVEKEAAPEASDSFPSSSNQAGWFTSPPPQGDAFPDVTQHLREKYHELGAILQMANERCGQEIWALRQAYASTCSHNKFLEDKLAEKDKKLVNYEEELQSVRSAAEVERQDWLKYDQEVSGNITALSMQIVEELKAKDDLSESLVAMESEKKVVQVELMETKDKVGDLEAENQRLRAKVAKMEAELKEESDLRDQSFQEFSQLQINMAKVLTVLKTPKGSASRSSLECRQKRKRSEGPEDEASCVKMSRNGEVPEIASEVNKEELTAMLFGYTALTSTPKSSRGLHPPQF